MIRPAEQLLKKLDHNGGRKKIRASSNKCVMDLVNHLNWLVSRHVRKQYSDDYLVSKCFNKSGYFKSDTELRAHCKINLLVATEQFEKMVNRMCNGKSIISFSMLQQHKEIIRDYLHDIRPIAEYLEAQRDNSYKFFRGGKNYGVHTLWIFHLSKQLAAQSAYKREKLKLDHKVSQIASIFVLRQALEAKFRRIIAVDFTDKNGRKPKLRHDFHYEFIIKKPHFFEFLKVDFTLLKYIYNWCHEIVHNVCQPYAWQINYSHELCSGLFTSGDLNQTGGWSIDGGIRIIDFESMQNEFLEYFSANYDHGIYSVEFRKPEAVIDYYNAQQSH